ncbi:hypothetical protein BVY04_04990 [bacterium M21]|nr:hypothetical protein BVY04_04990 [bacterium M21]
MKVTNFSVHHYMGVLVFCIGLLGLGAYSYIHLPRESFPDVRVPVVNVTSVLDGANPSDIELSVTVPIETAIDGTEGIKKITSSSMEGLSVVSVEFFPEVSKATALQRIRDAIDEAKADLPNDVEEPTVQEFTFSSIPILIYNLIGDDRVSRSEMKDLAEDLEDEIKEVTGVLDVNIIGGREEEVIIEIDPERLHFYNLSVPQVVQILKASNRNVSAGAATLGTNRIVMRVPGEYKTPGDMKEVVVGLGEDGAPIYLMDVALPRFGYAEETSRSRTYNFLDVDGETPLNKYVEPRKSVSLQITKRSGENILRIADSVADVFASREFPIGIEVVKGMDQSKDVKMMVGDLENGIGTSLILVLLVIFIGLGFRNAVLVSLAIPFSMLMAIIILRIKGETLNMMVLFSLILSLGMLVDNAIVIVENIYRHYCMGKPRIEAAMTGTAEVAWPVIASTATTVGAFFPLVFWPGLMGEFMSFLPMTVIIVLLCSLFVALVINPTLCSLLMRRKPEAIFKDPDVHKPDYKAVLIYERMLGLMLHRPGWTLVTASLLMVLTMITYGMYGAGVEFFPPVDPPTLICEVDAPEGVSLAESDRMCKMLEDRVFGAPGSGYDAPVANLKIATVSISLNSGGGMMDQGGGPVNVQLDFVDREYRTESTVLTLEEVRKRVEGLDKQGNRVTHPLFAADYNVIRPQEGPPTGKPVAIDIYGEDLNLMTRVAQDMKQIMKETPGTAKPTDDAATSAPTFEWEVDLAKAGMVGLDRGTISDFLKLGVGGSVSSTYGHGDDEQDIRLRMPEEYSQTSNSLLNIFVPTPLGGSVPLGAVAHAEMIPGPVTIRHYDRKRVIAAGAEVQPGIRADATIRDAFQKEAKQYAFPTGITYRFGGAAEEQEDAQQFLIQAFWIAVFIIIMVLVLQFNSLWMTAIVMVSVVLSLMGVFMGLLVLNFPFGVIMTGIGIISLAGVVVNNAIVLLDAVLHFEKKGMSNYDAIVTASMVRFRPVLLTAVTTILGLVPMALKTNLDFKSILRLDLMHMIQADADSAQWWQGMSVAVIFGLLVATVLTLGVVPTLALLYSNLRDRFRAKFHRGLQQG